MIRLRQRMLDDLRTLPQLEHLTVVVLEPWSRC